MAFYNRSQSADIEEQVDEDEDESSNFSDLGDSTFEHEPSPEEELANFRSKWKNELYAEVPRAITGGNEDSSKTREAAPNREQQAYNLFTQGIQYEKRGKLYEAIGYYRRAVQLVPDIEFRIKDYSSKNDNTKRDVKKNRTVSECSTGSELSDGDLDLDDLLFHFEQLVINDNAYSQPEILATTCHISDLPREILMHILKWVVTSELDVLSLENFAQVCRGFYICARDEEIWKLICQKVWGMNCGRPVSWGGWRNMYVERSHLRFNGVYIAKVSYYRQGEKSLDNYYKPYHIVEYYRYIRFLPEGQVLMLTTPDDPYNMVNQLRSRYSRTPGLLSGYYKHTGDTVTLVMQRRKTNYNTMRYYHRGRKDNNQNNTDTEQVFHAEFVLQNSKRRSNYLLNWQSYSIQTKSAGQEYSSEFHLDQQSYPPLIFSRVKSYTSNADTILC